MGESEETIAGLLPASVESSGQSVPTVDVVEGAELDDEFEIVGLFSRRDIVSYLGAAAYSYWEHSRAMGFENLSGVDTFFGGHLARTAEGIQKLFDYNTGDGTIVALGMLGSEIFLKSIDKLARNRGWGGFMPSIRFLASVGFGVLVASWLETTKLMNNTVDIPGDLFGVGLGAATILATRVMAERATKDNFEKLNDNIKKMIGKVSGSVSVIESNLLRNSEEEVLEESVVDTSVEAILTRLDVD